MFRFDIEYWYMNQQAYLKKKTKQLNRNALSQSPKATPISSSPRPTIERKGTQINIPLRSNRDIQRQKIDTCFSIQQMKEDPIKFLTHIKDMKDIPQNLLKLKLFREHIAYNQDKTKNNKNLEIDFETGKIIADLYSGTNELDMILPVSIK